jgi:adenylosuccinate lyase
MPTALQAISPIDGRYRSKVEPLANYFSESALIRYRVLVEVEYFIALSVSGIKQLQPLPEPTQQQLRDLYRKFTDEDAQAIKDIEKVTNHDVKAVEYFLKEQFDLLGLSAHKEFIHFGLTSQDINNTAIPLSIKDAIENVYLPELEEVRDEIYRLSNNWKDIPLLARTHGQPASPTRLGKEFYVFVVRIEEQMNMLEQVKEITTLIMWHSRK